MYSTKERIEKLMSKKYVYLFSEGNANMRELLGGKGANLAEMSNIGLPVPQGFTITTEACTQYYEDGRKINDDIMAEIMQYVEKMEEINGKKFGDLNNPMLVSVRSGARASMPGMMDTILNLGLNDDVVAAMIKGNPDPKFERFVYDSYRRFIQMFSDVVMEVGKKYFEQLIDEMKTEKGVTSDLELDASDLKKLAEQFKAEYKKQIGEDFPSDPKTQLYEAIRAVFRSWDNPRANVYRRDNDIPYSWGTAVNVMPMVFGNLNENSGTGVAFTRDPATGEKKLMGEFLVNAQGEDVVAGVRTPMPIAQMAEQFPEAYADFVKVCGILENHYHDMQDMEFTIQEGKLYMLQTRSGKRTIFSWLRSQVEMVEEGLIDKRTAVSRVPAGEFNKLFAPILDQNEIKKSGIKPITIGLNASPGGACGQVVFTAEDAEEWAKQGKEVILVRTETSPEDIGGMAVSKGVVTCRGGMTSHAAVVARGMGCPCVSGAGEIIVNFAAKTFDVNGQTIKEGDFISIDGFSGCVYNAKIQVRPSEIVQVLNGSMKEEDSVLFQNYKKFMSYVDDIKTMGVRTNADTPADTHMAVMLGAEGIGLCRTEHMFFGGSRIVSMRKMILANNLIERKAALAELLPMQRGDFEAMFTELHGLPANIRLLDPPLHEFLPNDSTTRHEMALALGISPEEVARKAASLHEFNPMLGFRGCRLAIIYPEILEMQVRAIIEAAINVKKKGLDVYPEIMIPLVGNHKEFEFCKDHAEAVIKQIFEEQGTEVKYEIGTMIEVPRAAVTADEIAQTAEFFSFGTNDLTQMTCGFSRDDAASFLGHYVHDADKQFYEYDPFATIDVDGVGKLMNHAAKLGRSVRPDIRLGICGEHGGDPKTIAFCQKVGLNYVSCSPYRVPIARLAAAQAAIN